MKALPPPTGPVTLVFEISRLFRQTFARRALHLKLTQAQSMAMACIAREPGLTQSELAEKLEVHPVTITQQIDRLQKAGWVRREAHNEDRRAFRLYVTEQADPILSELWKLSSKARADATQGLSTAELAQLEELLQRVKNNLVRSDVGTSRGKPLSRATS